VPLVQINNLEKVLGERHLFEKLAFSIEPGERVGLIGNNGEGKTTLFKMIVGEMTPDAGDINIPRGTKIGYLKQDVVLDPKNTVIDEAELAFADLHDVAHHMRELEHQMAEVEGEKLEAVLKEYEDAQHKFDDLGGYAFRHRLEATLLGVGLEQAVWETNVEKLSGGQRSRLALAKILIAEPDLLLLDEPTNHLDLVAIEWLENYLSSFPGAVLMISHDRTMLDRTANRIVWLTGMKLKSYPGNFTAFLQQKELEELSQIRARELQQKDIAKQAEFIRRFKAGQRAREAAGREKRLNRLLASDQVVQAVTQRRDMAVSFTNNARAGDQLLRVEDLAKSFGDKKLFSGVTFNVKPGQRIGILGPNGSGKTTMLKCLLGQIEPDAGTVRWGTNLTIGYYDQRLDQFDPQDTIYEHLHGSTDNAATDKLIRDVAGSLLFGQDDVEKHMGSLSGGERARVALAELMLEKPNVILLDEPTNHLDIRSAGALEQTLLNFEGTLLVVSHDRYFLKQIVNRILVLDPAGLIDFDGTFDEWIKKSKELKKAEAAPAKAQAKQQQKPVAPKAPEKPKAQKEQSKKKDNPYARKHGRLTNEQIEKEIASTESAIVAAQDKLAGAFRDAGKSKQLNAEIEQHRAKLRELEEEYFLREA